jgi:hypothetical protein
VSLSDVRVIMAIIHVLMVELICKMVMGWIPVLEYMLPGACGCLLSRLVLSGIK